MIIDLEIAFQSPVEIFGGVEVGGGEDLADPPVEALDHPVGLGVTRGDQSVFDMVFGTGLIEGVLTTGLVVTLEEAIGELGAVVGQEFGEGEGGFGPKLFEKGGGTSRRLFRMDLQVHPAGGSIDGDKQVPPLGFSWKLRQILDIDMDKAGFIVLEGLVRCWWTFLSRPQSRQIRDPMAAETAIQSRTAHARVNELPHHHQEVIHAQLQGGT